MDQKKSVPLEDLLKAVSLGNVEPEVLSSVAVRLSRLEAQLTDAERAKVLTTTAGMGLKELSRGIVQALDPHEDRSPQEAEAALREAVKPLSNPNLRALILTLKASMELVIDTVTQHRDPAAARLLGSVLEGADAQHRAMEREHALRARRVPRHSGPPHVSRPVPGTRASHAAVIDGSGRHSRRFRTGTSKQGAPCHCAGRCPACLPLTPL
jgi:type I restriction enzyme R subunit